MLKSSSFAVDAGRISSFAGRTAARNYFRTSGLLKRSYIYYQPCRSMHCIFGLVARFVFEYVTLVQEMARYRLDAAAI